MAKSFMPSRASVRPTGRLKRRLRSRPNPPSWPAASGRFFRSAKSTSPISTALRGEAAIRRLVPALSQVLPHTEIWIDAGTGSRGAARAVLAAPIATLVVGSESLENVRVWHDIVADAPSRTVLSLDFRGNEFMGPEALFDDPTLWPARVIVMTLDRVGSGGGPDVARLQDIASRAGSRRVYAAGGIRDRADLDRIRAVGAAGALVASALHAQKITAGDLKEIAGR